MIIFFEYLFPSRGKKTTQKSIKIRFAYFEPIKHLQPVFTNLPCLTMSSLIANHISSGSGVG